MAHVYVLPAHVDRVIDGDSFVCHVGLMPGKELHGEHVRVEGINAPEMSHAGGKEAKAFAVALLPVGMPVSLVSSRADKYGRCLAAVKLPSGEDFGQKMLAAGHAVPM